VHSKAHGRRSPPTAARGDAELDVPLGRRATHPSHIPWRGWRQVIRRTYREIISDRVSLIAAGCAFYATLALFPAITMLISVYGLIFDPLTVEPQLQVIREFLPPAAFSLIADRIHTLVSQGNATLGVSLLVSTAIALWSASTGTKSLLSALNMAYEEQESRSFLGFQAVGLIMTLGGILGASIALALLVFLPVAIDFVGLDTYTKALVHSVSLTLLTHLIHRIAGIRWRACYNYLESFRDWVLTPTPTSGQNLPCPPPTTIPFSRSRCQASARRKSPPPLTADASVRTAAFCFWPEPIAALS
jgi:hypothetical protein